MWGGIKYQDQKIYFPQVGVRLRDGNITWVTWGRRKNEANGQFPNGGGHGLIPLKQQAEALACKTSINSFGYQ